MNLNQVTLPVTDVARGVEFYRRLGLTPIVDALPRYARLECPGGATLSLERADRVVTPTGVVVYFECEDLDERCASLVAAGVTFESAPVDQPWLWREAYLADPDGHRICLFRAGENRRNPPWRVASHS